MIPVRCVTSGFRITSGPAALMGKYCADGQQNEKAKYRNEETKAILAYEGGRWILISHDKREQYSTTDNAEQDVPWVAEGEQKDWKMVGESWKQDVGKHHTLQFKGVPLAQLMRALAKHFIAASDRTLPACVCGIAAYSNILACSRSVDLMLTGKVATLQYSSSKNADRDMPWSDSDQKILAETGQICLGKDWEPRHGMEAAVLSLTFEGTCGRLSSVQPECNHLARRDRLYPYRMC